MAGERKRVWGELAAWHVSLVIAAMPLTGRLLNPDAINPYGEPKEESEAMRRIKQRIAELQFEAGLNRS